MQQLNVHDRLLGEPFFVTGTDTGVGKTAVAAALALVADEAGRDWRYFKPAESGPAADSDLQTIVRLCGRPAQASVGRSLRLPLAPRFAAETDNEPIDVEKLDEAFERLRGAAPIIVEGAGGVLAPYAENVDAAALAARWGLPVLVVVGNRIGCLNHALLTLEALAARAIEPLGCVFNDQGDDPSCARNVGDFERLSTIPVLAWLRRLAPDERPSAGWWRDGVLRIRSR